MEEELIALVELLSEEQQLFIITFIKQFFDLA